jgi:uncharacterized LabA/DUF88 family protein
MRSRSSYEERDMSGSTVGVFVDASHVMANGGYGMRYDVLRAFATRDGSEATRLNAYVAFDDERAVADADYRAKTGRYYSVLRDIGFKVVQRRFRRDVDEHEGTVTMRSNVEFGLAVDLLLQSERLDRIVLGTGDGDFVPVVRALQNRGCRVELVAFDNVAQGLREEVDAFFSGYLIPNLLPTESAGRNEPAWGQVDSRVRGYCYHHNDEKRFGFFRYLVEATRYLWITDHTHPDCPYKSAYFWDNELPSDIGEKDVLNREHVFEFTLTEGPAGKPPTAVDIDLLSRG